MHLMVQRLKRLTAAGAGNTLTTFRQKQSAVGGTLDQLARAVEKAVGLPLQRNAPVRTTVQIQADLPLVAHGKEFYAVNVKSPATRVW